MAEKDARPEVKLESDPESSANIACGNDNLVDDLQYEEPKRKIPRQTQLIDDLFSHDGGRLIVPRVRKTFRPWYLN